MVELVSNYNSYADAYYRRQNVMDALKLIPEVRDMWHSAMRNGLSIVYAQNGYIDEEDGIGEDENGNFISPLVYEPETNKLHLSSGFPDTILVVQVAGWLRNNVIEESLDAVRRFEVEDLDLASRVVFERLIDGDRLAFQNFVAIEMNFKHHLELPVPINIGMSQGHLRSFKTDAERQTEIMQRSFDVFQKSFLPQEFDKRMMKIYAEHVMDLYQFRSSVNTKDEYPPNDFYDKKLAHVFGNAIHRIVAPAEGSYYKAAKLGDLYDKLLSLAHPDVKKTHEQGKELCKLKFGEI